MTQSDQNTKDPKRLLIDYFRELLDLNFEKVQIRDTTGQRWSTITSTQTNIVRHTNNELRLDEVIETYYVETIDLETKYPSLKMQIKITFLVYYSDVLIYHKVKDDTYKDFNVTTLINLLESLI